MRKTGMIVCRNVQKQNAIHLSRKSIEKECDDVFPDTIVWFDQRWTMSHEVRALWELWARSKGKSCIFPTWPSSPSEWNSSYRHSEFDNHVSICVTYGSRAVVIGMRCTVVGRRVEVMGKTDTLVVIVWSRRVKKFLEAISDRRLERTGGSMQISVHV